MTRLDWQLRQMWDNLSWQGMVGIALLACAGVGTAAFAPLRHAELGEARAAFEALKARLHVAGPDGSGNAGGVRGDPLENFHAFFPPVSTLPDWLERIYAAAEQAGVGLESGEYKLVDEKNRRLVRYQLTLPVRGTYPQIRGFVAGVLNGVPAAALDDVGFRRETSGSTSIETRIRFTIYMGRA